MSVKYTILKAMFRIIPMQKIMAKPYDELRKACTTPTPPCRWQKKQNRGIGGWWNI